MKKHRHTLSVLVGLLRSRSGRVWEYSQGVSTPLSLFFARRKVKQTARQIVAPARPEVACPGLDDGSRTRKKFSTGPDFFAVGQWDMGQPTQ